VVEQTTRLEEMIRDMLEMGKNSTLKLSNSDLNDIVLEAVVMSQPMAAKAGVLLGNELEKVLPHLIVDRERVKRVVCNLLTNAIQACNPGESVIVRTARRKKGVTLEVIDSGCGVKQEHRKDLFTPFFSTKTGGTGLGLAIARRIIDANGGKLSFKPNSAKGTTFRVEFPL
jgi:signal transduction histidine kinase